MTLALEYLQRTILFIIRVSFILLVLRFFFIGIDVVDGQSMEPRLFNKEIMIISKFTLFVQPPHRFNIVQADNPLNPGHTVVKRVIGLPGETVIIKKNVVTIRKPDGSEFQLDEPYLKDTEIIKTKVGQPKEFIVPPDSYFLMGDNRMFSTDSRDFGATHRRFIKGVLFI